MIIIQQIVYLQHGGGNYCIQNNITVTDVLKLQIHWSFHNWYIKFAFVSCRRF